MEDKAHMNWPVFLPHVIRSEQIRLACELQQQLVLKAEQRRRSHNGRLRVYVPDYLLSTALGREECCRGVGVGIVRGYVDEAVYIVLGHGLGNPTGSLDVDILQREVPEFRS